MDVEEVGAEASTDEVESDERVGEDGDDEDAPSTAAGGDASCGMVFVAVDLFGMS